LLNDLNRKHNRVLFATIHQLHAFSFYLFFHYPRVEYIHLLMVHQDNYNNRNPLILLVIGWN
jgi:hypothetical protein